MRMRFREVERKVEDQKFQEFEEKDQDRISMEDLGSCRDTFSFLDMLFSYSAQPEQK